MIMLHSFRKPLADLPVANASNTTYGWSSENWSGYALTSDTQGTYTSISGTWVVPEVIVPASPNPNSEDNFWTWIADIFDGDGTTQSSSSYSATWIGIDGFTNSQLIQTGTAQNIVDGQAQYFAWWEILPNPETQLSTSQYPVSPGDEMQAQIAQQADGTWSIIFTDMTQNWTFTENGIEYTGPQTSAEWIEEAPALNGAITTLANYGSISFESTQTNNQNPEFTLYDAGVMIQNGQWISTPSQPNANGNGFIIGYGSSIPPAPTTN